MVCESFLQFQKRFERGSDDGEVEIMDYMEVTSSLEMVEVNLIFPCMRRCTLEEIYLRAGGTELDAFNLKVVKLYEDK